MAKHKSTYKRKSTKTKEKTSGALKTLLFLIVLFALAVTVNSVYPLTEELPTWQSLWSTFQSCWEETKPTQTVVPKDGEASVHFIDVGQGNCTLILSNDASVLIDAGETDQGQVVVDYLQSQGVTSLDYVIASHPHSDHIGGMPEVLEAVQVKHLIMPELKDSLIPTTRVYEKLLTAIAEHNIPVTAAKLGDTYEVGSGRLTILGPTGDFDDLNNMSVGVKFTYGTRSFLTTGDMEKEAEEGLLSAGQDLSADVFLLSHHGSKYSNCDELLDRIGASYYVAQMGYGNEYGHPHTEVVDRVHARGGTLYRSDVNGDVVFTTDGTSLNVQTEKG